LGGQTRHERIIFRNLSVRYIPDILNGVELEHTKWNFPTTAEFGDDYILWSLPKTLDKGNFSNEKSRIYPLLQTIRSKHDLPDNVRTLVHVTIKMQFLEFSYSNKVEIKIIGSLVLYEYEYEADIEADPYENHYETDTIGIVIHFQLCLYICIVSYDLHEFS